MSLSKRSVEELRTILAHGGGLRIDGSHRQIDELKSLAAHAQSANARLIIFGMKSRSLEDLKIIGAHGQGVVIFED